jgi:hypothetical protein
MRKEREVLLVLGLILVSLVLISLNQISALACSTITTVATNAHCYANVGEGFRSSDCSGSGVGRFTDNDPTAYPLGCTANPPCDSGHCSHYFYSHNEIANTSCGTTQVSTTIICNPAWINGTQTCVNGLAYMNYSGCTSACAINMTVLRNSTYDSSCLASRPIASLISVSWLSSTGRAFDNSTLVINGINLTKAFLNISIFNSSNKIILSNNYSSADDTRYILNWTPVIDGTYYFKVSFVNINQTNQSNNLLVSSTQQRPCNLSGYENIKPANANWNDNDRLGYFLQIYNSTRVFDPIDVIAKFNNTPGICNFNCSENYTWSSTSLKCNPIPKNVQFCWDIRDEYNCSIAPNSIAKPSLGDSGINCGIFNFTNIDGTSYNVDCSCVWVNGNCTSSRARYIPLNPKISSSFCEVSSSVDSSGCGSDIDIISVKQTAKWSETISPINCTSSSRSYPCPANYKLGFMDNVGLIIVILLLILIYIFILYKRKVNKIIKKSKK